MGSATSAALYGSRPGSSASSLYSSLYSEGPGSMRGRPTQHHLSNHSLASTISRSGSWEPYSDVELYRSQVICGSVIFVGVVDSGMSAVDWTKLRKIALSWVITIPAALSASALVFTFVDYHYYRTGFTGPSSPNMYANMTGYEL